MHYSSETKNIKIKNSVLVKCLWKGAFSLKRKQLWFYSFIRVAAVQKKTSTRKEFAPSYTMLYYHVIQQIIYQHEKWRYLMHWFNNCLWLSSWSYSSDRKYSIEYWLPPALCFVEISWFSDEQRFFTGKNSSFFNSCLLLLAWLQQCW